MAPGHRSATASASCAARRWSSASRSTCWSSATSPAAATMPAWRMAPPRRLRSNLARSMSSAEPASSDPTGAPSPLDRQHDTVVAAADSSDAGTPRATSAWNRRAPSRWTGSPGAASRSRSAAPQGAPPAMRWVFSAKTALTSGQWWSCASISQASSSWDGMPPGSSTACSCAEALTPAAPASCAMTCWRRPATTSVPGRPSRRRATWLAMVPEGTYMAASRPRRAATRASRAFTVGSSP